MNKRLMDKWERALIRVRTVMQEIEEKHPDYQLYLQESTAHLMMGDSHDCTSVGMKPRQDRIVRTVHLPGNCGGGAW